MFKVVKSEFDWFNFILVQKCGLVLQSEWGEMRTGVVEGITAEGRFPAVSWPHGFFPTLWLAVPVPAM